MAKRTRGVKTIYSGESGYTQVLSITAEGRLHVRPGQIITIFTPMGSHSQKVRQQHIRELVLDAMEGVKVDESND